MMGSSDVDVVDVDEVDEEVDAVDDYRSRAKEIVSKLYRLKAIDEEEEDIEHAADGDADNVWEHVMREEDHRCDSETFLERVRERAVDIFDSFSTTSCSSQSSLSSIDGKRKGRRRFLGDDDVSSSSSSDEERSKREQNERGTVMKRCIEKIAIGKRLYDNDEDDDSVLLLSLFVLRGLKREIDGFDYERVGETFEGVKRDCDELINACVSEIIEREETEKGEKDDEDDEEKRDEREETTTAISNDIVAKLLENRKFETAKAIGLVRLNASSTQTTPSSSSKAYEAYNVALACLFSSTNTNSNNTNTNNAYIIQNVETAIALFARKDVAEAYMFNERYWFRLITCLFMIIEYTTKITGQTAKLFLVDFIVAHEIIIDSKLKAIEDLTTRTTKTTNLNSNTITSGASAFYENVRKKLLECSHELSETIKNL